MEPYLKNIGALLGECKLISVYQYRQPSRLRMLHDTQRRKERRDPENGRRAARYARSLRGVWFDISDKEIDLLTEALKYHSDGYTEADITVQVCWDADRG